MEIGAYGFKIVYFNSKEDIISYASNKDYIIDQTKYPGICFGLSVVTSNTGHYDIQYHFNDQG